MIRLGSRQGLGQLAHPYQCPALLAKRHQSLQLGARCLHHHQGNLQGSQLIGRDVRSLEPAPRVAAKQRQSMLARAVCEELLKRGFLLVTAERSCRTGYRPTGKSIPQWSPASTTVDTFRVLNTTKCHRRLDAETPPRNGQNSGSSSDFPERAREDLNPNLLIRRASWVSSGVWMESDRRLRSRAQRLRHRAGCRPGAGH